MTLNVQEVSIALAIQNYNPTTLTPDFLKYSSIIPPDWELARPFVLSQAASQMVFKTGVSILAQTNRLVFAERIASRSVEEIRVAAIASKLIEILQQINYQGVAIAFRGHVHFEQGQSSARDYLFNTLLASGSWREFAPMVAAMKLAYRLPDSQLTLEINEAMLKSSEQVVPVVVFDGSFARGVAKDMTQRDRIIALSKMINNWQQDLASYQDIISTQFLQADRRDSLPYAPEIEAV